MPHPTLGQYLFDTLHQRGVRHAFGIPGDFALPTFRWLEKSPIELITMTHEPSVGFAADAYGRVTGLGVACVTYCVGGLNLLNAVACAYAEKSPLLVISGGPSPNDRRGDALIHHKVRTFDTQRRIFEEVTVATAVLDNPETAAAEIHRVVDAILLHSRPGYLEIPYDLVDLPIVPHTPRNRPAPTSDGELLAAAIDAARTKLASAKQPVMIADIELARFGLTDIAITIAERFQIPIASTLLSKSLIREDHPLYIGVYSGGLSEPALQQYVEESDCLLMLGAFITDVFLGMNTGKLERKHAIYATTEKIRVGLSSFDEVQLKEFLEGLAATPAASKTRGALPKPASIPQKLESGELNTKLTVEGFFRVLGLHVGEHNAIVCDTGDALIGAMGLRSPGRNDFLSDAYYLSMGFAMPAAIGVMAAKPDSRVFTIIGDGAFQMTGTELSTAAKYGMKPIVFVLNNDGYGTQRHILDGPFNNILMWDYTKLTDMLRVGKSYRVGTLGELESALAASLQSDQLALIEVTIPRHDSSPSLRRMGEALGKLRDVEKR
jgi:indolepyruvate decarboxylase